MGEITAKVWNSISSKTKKISGIFIGVLEFTENLADFEKKDQLRSLNISKVIDLDKCGYFNARKLLF